MRRVTFDGHDLAQYVYVEDVRRPLFAGLRVETATVGGRGGAIFKSAVLDTPIVEVDIRCISDSKEEMRFELSRLASCLAVDGPKHFTQSDRPGLYDIAIPTGIPQVDELYETGGATLQFMLLEPASYTENERIVTIPSGSSKTISLDGNYPTAPLLTIQNAIRDLTTGIYSIKNEVGDFIHIPLPDNSTHKIVIDCASDKRTVMVDNSLSFPSLDSDWLELQPGQHTLENDFGSGECVITFRERWL